MRMNTERQNKGTDHLLLPANLILAFLITDCNDFKIWGFGRRGESIDRRKNFCCLSVIFGWAAVFWSTGAGVASLSVDSN